jgi:hypothetical protein
MRALPCLFAVIVAGSLSLGTGGCASGPDNVFHNPTKDLQKTTKQLAADAAKLKYPAEAPHAGRAPVRGEVDYQLDVINLVNLSKADLKDVQVWVNSRYVVALSALPSERQVGINFNALYDSEGNRAPSKGVWVGKVEILSNGNLYDVTLHPAD